MRSTNLLPALLTMATRTARLAVVLPFAVLAASTASRASTEVKVGQVAPGFSLKNQDGKTVTLADRKGKGWTVVYFYPKAGTPGCTKQACAFRDAVKVIHAKNAEIYGISADTVEAQKEFHTEHKLTFDLLADPKDEAIEAYDVKMPLIGVAKRWTFLVDPELVVRSIDNDVDPALVAQKTADKLDQLQKPSAAAHKS